MNEALYKFRKKKGEDNMKKIMILLVMIITLLCGTIFAFAESDPAVVIVSPVHKSEMYANSLLISIKITQPKTIRVKVFEEKKLVDEELKPILAADWKKENGTIEAESVEFLPEEDFTCTNTLSFYTKQINEVKPGTYRVQVDTIGNEGKKLFTSYSLVIVSDKDKEETSTIFETSQSGTLQFLQNLLQSIFKDD